MLLARVSCSDRCRLSTVARTLDGRQEASNQPGVGAAAAASWCFVCQFLPSTFGRSSTLSLYTTIKL